MGAVEERVLADHAQKYDEILCRIQDAAPDIPVCDTSDVAIFRRISEDLFPIGENRTVEVVLTPDWRITSHNPTGLCTMAALKTDMLCKRYRPQIIKLADRLYVDGFVSTDHFFKEELS